MFRAKPLLFRLLPAPPYSFPSPSYSVFSLHPLFICLCFLNCRRLPFLSRYNRHSHPSLFSFFSFPFFPFPPAFTRHLRHSSSRPPITCILILSPVLPYALRAPPLSPSFFRFPFSLPPRYFPPSSIPLFLPFFAHFSPSFPSFPPPSDFFSCISYF